MTRGHDRGQIRLPFAQDASTASTIPSPWCPYFPLCARRGRATVGAWVNMAPGVRNRQIVCQTCGVTGAQSENLGNLGPMDPATRRPGEV